MLSTDMTDLEQRESVCRTCPERRTSGLYRWCAAKDETHTERYDCSRSRSARFSSRLTRERPSCDAWRPEGKIHLPDVPTVVYTCDKPNCVARHPRVTKLLTRLGFADWRFFWGTPGVPYWENIPREHAQLLRENEPPFLILEDDIALRDFQPWIAPPPGAELVFLGGGAGGRQSAIRNARQHLPGMEIRNLHGYGYAKIDGHPDWVRVFGMYYTHAILYTSKAAMLDVADQLCSRRSQIDVILGHEMWRWFCALRNVPMFWQDDGHHRKETYEYATPEPPVTREERRQLAHAARGR
jgi:hypothetical protein